MINQILKEYLEKRNNQEENYNAILSKIKEESTMKNKMRKVLNIAAIFLIIICVGTISTNIYAKIKWDIQFKEYESREYLVGTGAIKEAVESRLSRTISNGTC